MLNGCNRGGVLTEYSSTVELSEYGGDIPDSRVRDSGESILILTGIERILPSNLAQILTDNN